MAANAQMETEVSNKAQMRQSAIGNIVARWYSYLPAARWLLKLAGRLEGGQMFSLTLRRVLNDEYGVAVGEYSYGSLLSPGHADTGTSIGRYCSIGPNVRRIGAAHPMDELSLHPFWFNPRLGFVDANADVSRSTCDIAHDVWIGANVTILPGCKQIGVGAIIGAGSVVTRDVDAFTVVAGNPARKIAERLTPTERENLLRTTPWQLEPQEMHRALRALQGPD